MFHKKLMLNVNKCPGGGNALYWSPTGVVRAKSVTITTAGYALLWDETPVSINITAGKSLNSLQS